MLMTFPFKRLIAVLLPMSLIWLFVACISICAREVIERQPKGSVSSSTEIRDSSDCKCCPLTSLPTATIPERTIHGSDLQTPVAPQAAVHSVDSLVDRVAFVPRQPQRSFVEKPLKRMPALRI
jgi:hypothetical protein